MNNITTDVHIIGVGAVGSILAEVLIRHGLSAIHVHDFDRVEQHNIHNQNYIESDIGEYKVDALARRLKQINYHVKVIKHNEVCTRDTTLQGHIFLCTDTIESRKELCKANMYNRLVATMHDFRLRLKDGQYYFADWNEERQRNMLLDSMNFTHEEAILSTPLSACGRTLGVYSTNIATVVTGVDNFINHLEGKKTSITIINNLYNDILINVV